MVASPGGHGVQSPLEIVAIPLVIGGMLFVGVLWGTGVVIGSILGSTLPGSAGESVLIVLAAFPDVGAAWKPAIPSMHIWAATIVAIGVLAPFAWKMLQSGRIREEGAQWASRHQLRRAGLLVVDRSLAHAVPESPEVDDVR